MDYLSGPHLMWKMQKGLSQREIRRCYTADLEMERGLREEYRPPLEAGKGKEIDLPLGPPEGTQPCAHLGYSPVTPTPQL